MKIDINALKAAAARTDSDTAIVSRSWLRALVEDLTGEKTVLPGDRMPAGTVLATQ